MAYNNGLPSIISCFFVSIQATEPQKMLFSLATKASFLSYRTSIKLILQIFIDLLSPFPKGVAMFSQTPSL